MADAPALLELDDLHVRYAVRNGIAGAGRGPVVTALDGVSLQVHRGETVAVVGESGCGKSTLGRCAVRLQKPTSGRVLFDGEDITGLSGRQMRPRRGDLQMVFQNPYASLNPKRTVGSSLIEPMRNRHKGDAASRRAAALELLERVGLAAGHFDRYPHEFSGGQRQRIGIARAISMDPQLIVADEPVSALDVSVQAQIVNLLEDLQEERGLAYLLVSHDLSVVRQVADRVAVMYLGRIVELAPARELFDNPRHPYTQALLSAVPKPGAKGPRERFALRGDPPSATSIPPGCRFHPRCPRATDICRANDPALEEMAGRLTACHHPLGDEHEAVTAGAAAAGGA